MSRLFLASLLILGLVAAALADDVAITVYNQNLALVKEGRTLDLQKGVNRLNMTDVAAFIDPTSVHFRLRSNDRVDLLEQNFQYDLVSADKVLQKYLGQTIDVVLKNGDVVSGTYLSSSSGYLVLQLNGGAVRLINQQEMLSVTAPKLPEGLIVVPTLQWLLSSDVAGKRDAEISYLTGNISWHAEYIALLDKDDKNLRLSGWVSLDNRSGKTYNDAKLKLVAGDINRVQQRPLAKGMDDRVMMAESAPGFEEKAFFEYHLYTLGRPTTIANNETKQVSLFDPASTPITKIYRYDAFQGGNDVKVLVTFKNSEAGGLGMPLPAGKVRLTKLDSDGSEEFLGEDQIDHKPRNEDVELRVGNAFDIVAETAVVDSRRISDRVREETTEIKLRNRKTEAVTINVRYNLWGDWQILETNFEAIKKNAQLIEFNVPAKADTETVLRFRVRFNG
ncbi:MAG: DUF4139 domain-containing protein [candidate division Zixibacteria bacterium]|nr:DUF4139 domain-containing protein [candidate division Zixibacteria bacterium]